MEDYAAVLQAEVDRIASLSFGPLAQVTSHWGIIFSTFTSVREQFMESYRAAAGELESDTGMAKQIFSQTQSLLENLQHVDRRHSIFIECLVRRRVNMFLSFTVPPLNLFQVIMKTTDYANDIDLETEIGRLLGDTVQMTLEMAENIGGLSAYVDLSAVVKEPRDLPIIQSLVGVRDPSDPI